MKILQFLFKKTVFYIQLTTFLCLFSLLSHAKPIEVSIHQFDKVADEVELIKDNDLSLAFNKIIVFQEVLPQLSLIQRIQFYKLLAEIYVDQAMYKQCEIEASKGLVLTKKLTSPSILTTELRYARGFAIESLGNFTQATHDYLRGLEVAESLQKNVYVAYGLVNLGAIYYQTDQFERSLLILNEAKNIADKTNDEELKGFISSELGILHSYLDQDDKALKYYQQSYQHFKKTGKSLLAHNSLINIAINYSRNENYQKSIEIYKTIIAQNTDKMYPEMMYSIYAGIGWAYLKKSPSEAERAFQYLAEAEKYLHEVEQHDLKLQHYIDKAHILEGLKKYDEALLSLSKAQTWITQAQAQASLLRMQSSINILQLKAKIYQNMGDFVKANQAKSQEILLTVKQYQSKNIDETEDIRIRLEANQADVDKARLVNEQKLRVIELNKVNEKSELQQKYLLFGSLTLLVFSWLIVRLTVEQRKLKQLTNTDALTGLSNRYFIMTQGQKLFEHTLRKRHDFSVLMLEVDYINNVEGDFSHSMTDVILKTVAKIGLEIIHEDDVFGYFGGKEMIVLLPKTTLINALALAREYNLLIKKQHWPFNSDLVVTLSIGVANSQDKQAKNLAELIKYADKFLNEAKRQGGNMVCG